MLMVICLKQCCESIEASELQDCSLGDINGVLGGAGAGLSGDVGRLNRRLQMIGSIPIQDHGPVLRPQGFPPEECMCMFNLPSASTAESLGIGLTRILRRLHCRAKRIAPNRQSQSGKLRS